MIYCMNGKILSTKYICSAIFTALNLVKIVTYLYIGQFKYVVSFCGECFVFYVGELYDNFNNIDLRR